MLQAINILHYFPTVSFVFVIVSGRLLVPNLSGLFYLSFILLSKFKFYLIGDFSIVPTTMIAVMFLIIGRSLMTWVDLIHTVSDALHGVKHLPFFAVLFPGQLELIDYFAAYFEFVLS